MITENCTRCNANIVTDEWHMPEPMHIFRYEDTKKINSDRVFLCSTCLDEIWDWVFENDIDRSDKVDPRSVEKVKNNIERFMEDMQDLTSDLESIPTTDKSWLYSNE